MATTIEPIASGQNQAAVTSAAGNAARAEYAQRLTQQAQRFNLTLLNLLGANTNTPQTATTTTLASSDLLTLSPEALNILNGVENAAEVQSVAQPVTDATFNAPLSLQQEDSLNSIVEQYNGQPLDQTTLVQLQQQLAAAGINPQQISIQELILALGTTAIQSSFAYNTAVSDDVLTTELLAA